jgi:ADP-ribosyl-[dinitrogen reductase] hydrolase
MITTKDRFQGCLVGLAVGDAVGTTLEFKKPGTFAPISDMVGGGPFHLRPGYWTDDTSMAICLAESLIHCKGMNHRDQMGRYLNWYRHGYWSSVGTCFDIGNTVCTALHLFESTDNPVAGSKDPYSAGNGSLMRLAPVPMFYARNPEAAMLMSAESSLTTHATRVCLDACRYYGGLMVAALHGRGKEELLSANYRPFWKVWEVGELDDAVDRVAQGSFKERNPPDIAGTGYVVRSMEAALWAFYNSDNFRDGCLMAANLGNDADTTAAIYGQLAGAYYGMNGIPEEWRIKLCMRKEIVQMADDLFQLSYGEEGSFWG